MTFDSKFVINRLMVFLELKHNNICITDTNKNFNNWWYQLIGGNYVVTIGNCLLYSGMLKKSLPQYLYHPK